MLGASHLFSYLTSNHDLGGGEGALRVDRGGKETSDAKCPGHMTGKKQSWASQPRPSDSRSLLRTTCLCPAGRRPCAECSLRSSRGSEHRRGTENRRVWLKRRMLWVVEGRGCVLSSGLAARGLKRARPLCGYVSGRAPGPVPDSGQSPGTGLPSGVF